MIMIDNPQYGDDSLGTSGKRFKAPFQAYMFLHAYYGHRIFHCGIFTPNIGAPVSTSIVQFPVGRIVFTAGYEINYSIERGTLCPISGFVQDEKTLIELDEFMASQTRDYAYCG